MKQTVAVALFGWPLVSLVLFLVLSPRRALIASFVAGWLVLPVSSISFSGLPDVSKATSLAASALLGVLAFDARRLRNFRPHPIDLAALTLTLAPLPASLSNGLGVYDGLSGVAGTLAVWGVPWLMGRVYGSDPRLLRDVLVGMLIGALAYVPICIWEMRMSPQINYWLYGFYPFEFHTTRRLGGYRPVGFLRHGIELGMMMMSASLASVCIQAAGRREQILGLPISWVSAILLCFTVLTRAIGAWILLAAGIMALFATRTSRSAIPIALLILAPVVHMGLRVSGGMPEEQIVSLAATVSPERADSLRVRLENEAALADKAFERPIFGWAGWGRNRIYDERGEDQSLTDGMWIILFGQYGIIGLGSWLIVLLAPPALVLRRMGARRLLEASSAPALAAIILLPLHTVNWLVNGFPNPVVPMLASSLVTMRRQGRAPSRPRQEEARVPRATQKTPVV